MKISGVYLKSLGQNRVVVEVETVVDGEKIWVPVINEHVPDVGGVISHIVEPLGIEAAINEVRNNRIAANQQ